MSVPLTNSQVRSKRGFKHGGNFLAFKQDEFGKVDMPGGHLECENQTTDESLNGDLGWSWYMLENNLIKLI